MEPWHSHRWELVIAQTVIFRHPTATVRARTQVRYSRICGGQIGTGTDFLRVLLFPLPISFAPIAPLSSVIRGWYNRPNSDRRAEAIQSHPLPRN
jgi:hypothetical protein